MTGWGGAAVRFGGLTGPAELVEPLAVETVYSWAERVRSGAGRTLQHWAGRLAAKEAVLRSLGVEPTAQSLGAVEVLPRPSALCRRGVACQHGHPPGVTLHPPLRPVPGLCVRISVSHTTDLAVAVAVVTVPLEEDQPWS